MIIGILKETGSENRVAILPGEVIVLKKMGIEVLVEINAGERAFANDKAYRAAGALTVTRKEVISEAAMWFLSIPLWKMILILSDQGRFCVRLLTLSKTANGLSMPG
jgi:alanine dehydrogenase